MRTSVVAAMLVLLGPLVWAAQEPPPDDMCDLRIWFDAPAAAQPGDILDVVVYVANSGPAPCRDLTPDWQFSDALLQLEGTTFAAPEIPVTEQLTYWTGRFQLDPAAPPGPVSAALLVGASNDADAANNRAVWNLEVTAPPPGALDLSVSVDPPTPFLGGAADYTVVVTGAGGEIAELVVQLEIDCSDLGERVEVAGDADDLLEPGDEWHYTCHTDAIEMGFVAATARGVDEHGDTVEESVHFNAGIHPFDVQIISPAGQVSAGEEATWQFLITNLAPYSIVDVRAEARVLYEGRRPPIPYETMAGPVEVNGNGDDLLDPGEQWAFSFTAYLWTDSSLHWTVGGVPAHAPWVATVGTAGSSAIVAVLAPPPTTQPPAVLPYTGAESLPLAVIGLLCVALGTLAAGRRRSGHGPGPSRGGIDGGVRR